MSDYVMDAKRVIEETTHTRANWSGLCLWIDEVARTSSLAPVLLGFGCRWSQKRKQWYWRHEEAA